MVERNDESQRVCKSLQSFFRLYTAMKIGMLVHCIPATVVGFEKRDRLKREEREEKEEGSEVLVPALIQLMVLPWSWDANTPGLCEGTFL